MFALDNNLDPVFQVFSSYNGEDSLPDYVTQ